MSSRVYFADLSASHKDNLLAKLERLLLRAGLGEIIGERDLTAVKVHFGESGNTAFVRPVYLRTIVETIKRCGGEPFLTDTNTLYAGTRATAPGHIRTAVANGFADVVVGAPIIIADGLRGSSETAVHIGQKRFETVYIGSEIAHADKLVAVAHFKGHELCGFGGALKNIGMGCASRRGKMAQHARLAPKIKPVRCTGCGDCVRHCAHQAIRLTDNKACIDAGACSGCGQCVLICAHKAVRIRWHQDGPAFMEHMVEYALGALQAKKDKVVFVNFITDISPACDCPAYNDAPIVRDIGFVASRDPVAVDQASVDLVNREQALPGRCPQDQAAPGGDKFRGLYPEVDWAVQLDYAARLGLGSRAYELIKI